tara:strand:+ start:223 stop:501 length:279 start_codon:yes stop_codon:yes gene_type:complete
MKEYLQNPILISIISGIIASIISLIDHKLNDDNFVIDYVRYIKILLLVACLSYGGLLLSVKSTDNIQTGGGSSISNVNGLNIEEIYTGNPTF